MLMFCCYIDVDSGRLCCGSANYYSSQRRKMDLQQGLVVDAHAGCDAAVIVAGDCAAAVADELDAD